jgi:hypothetical protein
VHEDRRGHTLAVLVELVSGDLTHLDAGRAYFDDAGLTELAAWELAVPLDLEGVTSRVARAYRM